VNGAVEFVAPRSVREQPFDAELNFPSCLFCADGRSQVF
jgi:hypothetical protein